MNSSCKDCTDRTLGCHSHCEKYAKFKEAVSELNKARQYYRVINDLKYEGKERMKNSRRLRRSYKSTILQDGVTTESKI